MRKYQQIFAGIHQVARLRFKDPRLCRCMLASLLFAVAASSFLARAQAECLLLDPGLCMHTLTTLLRNFLPR